MLSAFRELAAQVQRSGSYSGGELEELIRGLGAVLDNKERPGEDADYLAAIPILRELRQNFSANGRASIYLDADLTALTKNNLYINAVTQT